MRRFTLPSFSRQNPRTSKPLYFRPQPFSHFSHFSTSIVPSIRHFPAIGAGILGLLTAGALFAQAEEDETKDDQIYDEALEMMESGRSEEAMELWDSLVLKNPRNSQLYIARARCFERMGDLEGVVRDLDLAISLDPEDSFLYLVKGNTLARIGRDEEAVGAFDMVERYDEDGEMVEDALAMKAEPLFRLGRLTEALDCANRVLGLSKKIHNIIAARMTQVLVFSSQGRVGEAEDSVRKLDALKPDSVFNHNLKGNFLLQIDRLPEALKAFESGIEEDPYSADLHYGKGECLSRLKRPEESLVSFDNALELGYAHPVVIFVQKGLAYYEMQKWKEAIEYLDKAVALDPRILEELKEHRDSAADELFKLTL